MGVRVFVFASGLYIWAYLASALGEKEDLDEASHGYVRVTIKQWEDNGILQIEDENGFVVRLHENMTCRGHPDPTAHCKAMRPPVLLHNKSFRRGRKSGPSFQMKISEKRCSHRVLPLSKWGM